MNKKCAGLLGLGSNYHHYNKTKNQIYFSGKGNSKNLASSKKKTATEAKDDECFIVHRFHCSVQLNTLFKSKKPVINCFSIHVHSNELQSSKDAAHETLVQAQETKCFQKNCIGLCTCTFRAVFILSVSDQSHN